jgi:hypothetical protein
VDDEAQKAVREQFNAVRISTWDPEGQEKGDGLAIGRKLGNLVL